MRSRFVLAASGVAVLLVGCGGQARTTGITTSRQTPGGDGVALSIGSVRRSTSPSSSPSPPTRLTPPAHVIVFARAASDSLDSRIEIAYVPARGGAIVSLTDAGKAGMVAAEPRWSPNGSRIAFVMSPLGHLTRYAGDGDIYVMNSDGTGIRQLTHGLDASSPAWSPEGSRIAYVQDQGQELVVMRADGSGQHVIARARGYYESPAWSPDGRTIAYQSSPTGNIDLTAVFTIRPDGTHERQLTSVSASAGFPAWSPDGTRIAYSAGDQLWIMNSDGTGARRLTNCRLPCVFDFAPAWSPNGSKLVFVQQENGGAARRLYILELATGAVSPLTPSIQWAASPDWRPG
jgi:TolB protein